MQSSVNFFGKPRWQEYLDLPENDLAQHCQVSEDKSLSRLVIDGVEHQPYAFMFSINSAICEAFLHPLTSTLFLQATEMPHGSRCLTWMGCIQNIGMSFLIFSTFTKVFMVMAAVL